LATHHLPFGALFAAPIEWDLTEWANAYETHVDVVDAENTQFFHVVQLMRRGTVPGQKTPPFTNATNGRFDALDSSVICNLPQQRIFTRR
jgi:hypothetical protein